MSPAFRLDPDLVNRLSSEAAQLSDRFLRMCFRAFDYMPPVDVDFLRALVTSDLELNPADPGELRFETIEAFRERGIYPSGVQSLAEEGGGNITGALNLLQGRFCRDLLAGFCLRGELLCATSLIDIVPVVGFHL